MFLEETVKMKETILKIKEIWEKSPTIQVESQYVKSEDN